MNLKILIFHIHFLNMDVSLSIGLTCLKTCMYIAELGMKGRVSPNFDLGLSFYFMLCRRRHFEKKIHKKTQKLPVFHHKIKTRA